MNPLLELARCGQSVWLDDMHRTLITSGELERLVRDDGLAGLTSNPTIFAKAISGQGYDGAIRSLLRRDRSMPSEAIYDALAVEDLRMAADALRPVWDARHGADGFVSIEVSPRLAEHTAATEAEARRLFHAVDRPNVMVKIPATAAGIPAIERMIAEGVAINVTLMFSLAHYEAVAGAHLRGLEHCARPEAVASVASFFVSRIDTKIDRALAAIGTPDALALPGRIAIANAKRAYRRFREIFSGERFAPLARAGAKPQRVLFASTSTKDPAYSDVLYAEELVGPDTVDTMTLATLYAMKDHGRVRCDALEHGVAEADRDVFELATLGIDLDAVGDELQREGVASFARSLDEALASIENKRRELLPAAA